MTQPHVAQEGWADWQTHHDIGCLPGPPAMKGSPTGICLVVGMTLKSDDCMPPLQ